MSGEILQKMLTLLAEIHEQMSKIDNKLDRTLKIKDCLGGDSLMDNTDVCKLLGITTRTLLRYRQLRLIKHYSIEGKIFYKTSEVAAFISSFEINTWKDKEKE